MVSDKLWALAIIVFLNHLYGRFAVASYYREYVRIRKLRKTGTWTKGVIIGHIERKDADDQQQFAPVVQFHTADGGEYTVESDDFRHFQEEIGERITVAYHSKDPARGIVAPVTEARFAFLKLFMLVLFAVVVIAMAIMGALFGIIIIGG